MSDKTVGKNIVGRAEQVGFPELGISSLAARIDTGAKTSSIWASFVQEEEGVLTVILFDQNSPYYSGQKLSFQDFDITVVSTSTGQTQKRYKVRLLVKIKGRKIRAWFTLADRSAQVYPVLIGRNILRGKFVVDVREGRILKGEEQRRTAELRTKLDKTGEENV